MQETIKSTVKHLGLQQFKDVTILLHAKNLKTLTKDSTQTAMTTRFKRYQLGVVDKAYISNDFYYNIRKETCLCYIYLLIENVASSPLAKILLQKKCCLDSYYAQCQNNKSLTLYKQTLYPTAVLRDIASISIKPFAKSQQRTSRLLYSQFCTSIKEVFAARN